MEAFRDEIIKQAIDEQLIKDLSGIGKLSLFVHLGLATVVFFLLKNIVSYDIIIIWLLPVIIISVAHVAIQYPEISHYFSIEKRFVIVSLLMLFQALIWSNGIVFISYSIPGQYQLFLIFAAGGLTAGAVAVLYPSLLIYCIYAISMMMPIVINQLMKGSAFSSMTAAAIMFFLAIMIFSAANSNRKYKEYNITRLTLDKQRAFIQKIYNAAHDISFITCETKSNEYRIISFSRGSEAFFEYKSKKAIGKSLKEIQSQESYEKWAKLIAEVCGNAIPIKGEMGVVKNSGEINSVIFSIYPLFNENDEIHEVLIVSTDITERKHSEEVLRQSEQKYRSLVESMHDGVSISDLDENILFINEAVCKIFGYSREELTKMNFKDMVVDEEIDKMLVETQKRIEGKHGVYELTIRRKDGQLRHILISATPLYDKHRKVEGSIGIFTDITDQKKAENERRELREKLTRAQRMESLGVLAGGVAHDLNNILGPLVAYPELIRMEYPEDNLIKRHVAKIENSAKRAADVVQDLLTMARRGRYEMTPIAFNEVIDSYLQSPDFFNLKSKQPDVIINVDLDRTIPRVHGSASHLSKVIMNLIINAFEAMPEGGDLTIVTQSRYIEKLMSGFDNIEAGKYVIMTVSDTGSGIAPEDLKHLFEPFYSKKEMGKSGSGLGLAIVYGVIKDHNGYIDVKSEVDKGTEFVIYLPVIEAAIDKDANVVMDIRGSEKILIVDDIEEQRALAATILSSLGYNLQTAPNGKKALELLNDNKYDIVILDMILDKSMDGLDIYKEIIKLNPGQKAIITSGFSKTDRVIEAETLGVGKFVKKPYTMQKIGKAIREVLDLKPVEV